MTDLLLENEAMIRSQLESISDTEGGGYFLSVQSALSSWAFNATSTCFAKFAEPCCTEPCASANTSPRVC